jgi:hypothetical protein
MGIIKRFTNFRAWKWRRGLKKCVLLRRLMLQGPLIRGRYALEAPHLPHAKLRWWTSAPSPGAFASDAALRGGMGWESVHTRPRAPWQGVAQALLRVAGRPGWVDKRGKGEGTREEEAEQALCPRRGMGGCVLAATLCLMGWRGGLHSD